MPTLTFVLVFIGAFDKPLKVDTVKLDGDATLTCFVHSGFVVKQVASHDHKGAVALSFVRFSGTAPICDRATAPGTVDVLNGWGGYYAGSLGHLAVFDGDDGWQGGVGFIVYDTTSGTRVFQDARVDDMAASDTTITYKRLVPLDCNAAKSTACAGKAAKLAATKRDVAAVCKASYADWAARFKAQVAKIDNPCDAACKRQRKTQIDSFLNGESVIAYGVSVDRTTFAITPQAETLECWPSN